MTRATAFVVDAGVSAAAVRTPARDDTRSSGPVLNARLLSAEERACPPQRTGDLASETQLASNAVSLHETLQTRRTPKHPAYTLTG
jgi:hypothetical protein